MPARPATWLSRMQEQSNNAKERFAFLVASGVTGVVAIVWAIALMFNISDGFGPTTPGPANHESSFFSSSKSQLASLMDSLQADLDALNATNTADGVESPSASLQAVVDQSQYSAGAATTTKSAPLSSPKSARMVLIATSSRAQATTSNSAPQVE